MPIFLLDKARAAARSVRALVGSQGRDERDRAERRSERRGVLGEELRARKQELRRIKERVKAGGERAETVAAKKDKKRVQQEIFRLRREFRAVGGTRAAPGPVTGALPDFVVVGAMKGGTTWLYHLLTRHPHVEPAAAKELHYFDVVCEDEDVEWYRGCFPRPRLKDGRMTITGEATPYLPHPLAPERMAEVVPDARLIAVLRNPVDRTYSHYQQMARKGRETRTFEEAVSLESLQPHANGDAAESAGDSHQGYVSKSLYADQLPRWAELFGRERMLILKSEDLFARTPETLAAAFDFLGLPEFTPEEVKQAEPERRRNKGTYRQGMDPSTRQRLEEFFEPHNRRLYDYLGRDLGW